MSTKQKLQREETASENLTEYVAQKDMEEDLLGEPRKATVTDVKTEFEEDESMLVEFEVKLPDQSTGYLRFSDYHDELLEDFLESELHTTHAEMNVVMEEFTVVRTDYGWEAKIGDAPLDYVFEENNSWFFNINDIGMAEPNRIVQYSLLSLSLLPAVKFGVMWLVLLALMYMGLILFIYIPFAVMLSPMSKDINKNPVEEPT